MNPTSGLFFLLSLTLCLALHPHLTVAATNSTNATTTTNATGGLIEKACSRTHNKAKDFCLWLLNSNPDSKTATDLKDLAIIALGAAYHNASETSMKIQSWFSDTEAEHALNDALSTCDEAYIDVVDQIGDSETALVSGTNGDVKSLMKVAMARIDACDAGLKGLTMAHAVELTKQNRALRQSCNVALRIVHVVAHG